MWRLICWRARSPEWYPTQHRHQPPTPPFHLHRLSQVVDTPSHPKLPVSVVGITVTVAAGTRVQLRSTLVSIIAGISGRFSSHSTKGTRLPSQGDVHTDNIVQYYNILQLQMPMANPCGASSAPPDPRLGAYSPQLPAY